MINSATQKRTLRRAAWGLIVGTMLVGVLIISLTFVFGHAPPTF